MKTKIIFLYVLVIALICANLFSCVGDPYYEKLNSAPTVSISSHTDTVKISSVAFTKELSAIVSCYDYNMNMRILSYDCENGADILLLDAKNSTLTSKIQIGNNIEKFDQKITFRPQKEGDFVINFKVMDAFTTKDTVQYKIHAFTNLVPIAAATSCALSGNTLAIDLSSSYDMDKKYGGAVTGYLVYIDGEKVMDFNSPKMNVILSPSQLSNLSSKLTIAVRDNDGQLSTIVKPTIK